MHEPRRTGAEALKKNPASPACWNLCPSPNNNDSDVRLAKGRTHPTLEPQPEKIDLKAYRDHVAERAALGIPAAAADAKQTSELIELLKNPPAGEEATWST
jgi:hypothetical protein